MSESAPAAAAPAASTTSPATTAPAATQPMRVAPVKGIPTKGNWWWGTGRRKTAVARVRIRPGTGSFIVNDKDMTVFFTEERDRNDIMNVLEKTGTKGSVDVVVNAHGGGFTGQAGAVLLGLARALNRYDPNFDPILREHNFLTRDSRKVERKKYGQAGARRRFQFSKR